MVGPCHQIARDSSKSRKAMGEIMSKLSKLRFCPRVRSNRSAVAAALLAFAFGGAAHAFDQGGDNGGSNEPLVLQSEGSFFVGGQDLKSDALNSSAASAGTVTIDQMYVQYQIPVSKRGEAKTSVIMIHGCCLSAKSWEETPDGRMGWNEYFVRRGHPTYVPDQVSRGRSGFDATALNEIALGLDGKTAKDIPFIYSIGHEGAYTSFRFGATVGVPYSDEQFPVKYADEFYKQLVPDLNGFLGSPYPPTPNPTYNDLSALAIRLGGAVIIGHSESGFFPENAALVSTSHIKGMVSIEPGGSCTTTNPSTLPLTAAQIKTLAMIPTLVIYGDHLVGSWLNSYANCQAYAAAIKAAGGDITFVHLPDVGIHGNSHMMMIDKNNLQVADVILNWIDKHVDRNNGYGGH
jgi:pimeloyl-ACP methyl ester carboxylesterase